MMAGFHIFPVGMIHKHGDRVQIEIDPPYTPAMKGLEHFFAHPRALLVS